MNRRSFISTCVGLVAASGLPLPVPARREIPLAAFCGTWPGSRIWLETPWVKGGMKYASDHYMLLAVPTDEPDSAPQMTLPKTGKVRVRPRVDTLAWGHPDGQWLPWNPTPQLYTTINHQASCCEFDGDECPCDDGCEKCDHTGLLNRRPCWKCGGSEVDSFAVISGRRIQNQFVRRISELLPGPIEYMASGPVDEAMPFRFDGGQGLIMPLSNDEPFFGLTPEQTAACRSIPVPV